MTLAILGIGSATPQHGISQQDAAVLASTLSGPAGTRPRTLSAIYRQTQIEKRGSVLLEEPGTEPFAQTFFPPACHAADAGPTTAERVARYAATAGPLAITAAKRALEQSDIAATQVTHLVTCSCTGFATPGVDLELCRALNLPADVARTHIGFMGCHGAFNALRAAGAFARTRPDAVVLVVCVELCSLHFQYGATADSIVANSIFADGAAAVVGRSEDTNTGRTWRLIDQTSAVLPHTADQMGWTIGDHGFEMTLSAEVPGSIAGPLPGLIDKLLARHGLLQSDVAHWAVHPGGPRVLTAVETALSLAPTRLAASRRILAEHGNMSSSTILFILELLFAVEGWQDGPSSATSETCVAMAFGPGLTAELALFVRGKLQEVEDAT
jgi:predicted naringenin-chalcone synthase